MKPTRKTFLSFSALILLLKASNGLALTATESKHCNRLASNGIHDVRCYGAVINDPDRDASAGFQQAIKLADNLSEYAYVRPGVYYVRKNLYLDNANIFGAHSNNSGKVIIGSKITSRIPNTNPLASAKTKVTLSNLIFDGAGTSSAALEIEETSSNFSSISGVAFTQAGTGLHASHLQSGLFENILSQQNSKQGISIYRSHSLRLNAVLSSMNGADGLFYEGDFDEAGYPQSPGELTEGQSVFTGVSSIANAGVGISIAQSNKSLLFTYPWSENNSSGIVVNESYSVVINHGRLIETNVQKASAVAVRFIASFASVLEGMSVGDTGTYSTIKLESNSRDSFIFANTFHNDDLIQTPALVNNQGANTALPGEATRNGSTYRGLISYRNGPPNTANNWRPGDLIFRLDNPTAPQNVGWVFQPTCNPTCTNTWNPVY